MFYVKSRGAIPRSHRVEDIFQEWPAAADDQSSLSADGSKQQFWDVLEHRLLLPLLQYIYIYIYVYIYILTMTDYD